MQDSTPHSNIPNLAYIFVEIATVLIFPAIITAVHSIHFGLARTIVLPILFKLPVISSLLRPVAAHFLRGSWTLILLVCHTGISVVRIV